MQPLIQSFTKTLSPCSGCGNSAVDYFTEQTAKGEKMLFVLQSQIEADDVIQALAKKNEATVISINPQRPTPQPGQITGSSFQRTTTQPTPQLQPNG